MSNDHDFEQVLSARMRSAAEPVTGAGVTPERVDGRVAQRRRTARRRQGLAAIAAAVVVVLGGVGIAAAVDRDTPSEVASEGDPSTTEAPATDPCPSTTSPPSTATSTVTTLGPEATPSTLSGDGETSTVPADVEGTGPAADPTAPDPCAPGTTEPPTTVAPDTTAPPTTPTTVTEPEPELVPGQACAPGSSPDCIDPEGDGSYVYLIGGADCMANPIGDSGNVYAHCIDLDGDGDAGYGDEGEPAPTTQPAGSPGAACTPSGHPDCIDPEGDGTYVWLIGGGDCMASPIGGAMCADLDGDGHAGYPDSEG